MKKIVIYSLLLFWTIWALFGIVPNAHHYSFLDWIIVIIVYAIPCSILIAIDRSTSAQHKKDKSAIKTNIPLNDSSPEQDHLQQGIEESSSTSYSKTDLLAWQNVLYPDTPQLRYNASQLKQLSVYTIPRQSEIAHDCMELINSTTVPETFFSRYNLLIEKLTLLSNLEQYVKFNKYSPTQQLSSVIRKKTLATNAFIDRYWNSTVEKASSLKTEKGRRNRYQKFYDTLLKYADKMTEENMLYVENIVKDKIDIETHKNALDAQTSNLQNILIDILTRSVKRKMGGGVAFETSDDEDKFFRELILNALENNLEPKNFYFEPMSNKSFSIYYQDLPIGRIKLYGKKTYMQILNGLLEVNKLYDLSLDEYIIHIPEWIKYIEYCINLKEQCLIP